MYTNKLYYFNKTILYIFVGLFQTRLLCDALLYLAPFLQFKEGGKHPWRSVTFSKVAGFSNFT